MNYKTTFILMMLLSQSAQSNEHFKIDTLGSSKAGQFVALEEYGYKSHTHSYVVRVKILNVWTKEYVGKEIEVEEPALNPQKLSHARAKAKSLAKEDLERFKILDS